MTFFLNNVSYILAKQCEKERRICKYMAYIIGFLFLCAKFSYDLRDLQIDLSVTPAVLTHVYFSKVYHDVDLCSLFGQIAKDLFVQKHFQTPVKRPCFTFRLTHTYNLILRYCNIIFSIRRINHFCFENIKFNMLGRWSYEWKSSLNGILSLSKL